MIGEQRKYFYIILQGKVYEMGNKIQKVETKKIVKLLKNHVPDLSKTKFF